MIRALLPLLFLAACDRPADDDSGAGRVDSGDDSPLYGTPYIIIPAGTAMQVEIEDGQTWSILADGDCIDTPSMEICPSWDFSHNHQVVDGYLETVNGPYEGYVVNVTDRNWHLWID